MPNAARSWQTLAATCMMVVFTVVPLCATATTNDINKIVLPAPLIWPMFPTDVRRASQWQLTTGGPTEFGSPAIAPDHTVYVGTDDGTLYAINPNGSFQWTVPTRWLWRKVRSTTF
jgi:hypothetical protein